MKPLLTLAGLSLCLMAAVGSAQTRIITDAGREVLIHDDGTWEFASGDRMATLPDGSRVRLMDDGQWESVDATASPSLPVLQVPVQAQAAVVQSGIELEISTVTIESRTERVQKNVRTYSQTVFDMDLLVPSQATAPLTLDLAAAGALRVEDSGGGEYEILDISPASVTAGPGQTAIFTIRVDGSPSFRSNKQFMVTLDRSLTGTARDLVADIDMSRARERALAQ